MSKAHPGIAKNRHSLDRWAAPPPSTLVFLVLCWMHFSLASNQAQASGPLVLEGLQVVPHVQSTNVLYLRNPSLRLGARVQLFLRNSGSVPLQFDTETFIRLRSRSPDDLVADGEWSWHDMPSVWPHSPLILPPGGMTVWSFNGAESEWGVNSSSEMAIAALDGSIPSSQFGFRIDAPKVWISSCSFLGGSQGGGSDLPAPQRALLHIANQDLHAIKLKSVRFWSPESPATSRALMARAWDESPTLWPSDGVVSSGDRGVMSIPVPRLPLSYVAVEVRYEDSERQLRTLWTHLRLRREHFALSGGWVESNVNGSSTLTQEPFLQQLNRMHVDTAHIGAVPGYTDHAELYAKYPLRLFNRLQPVTEFDTDAWLPKIHAVEFLGEPQYGGGKPVPPMEVWKALAPYHSTRLPTTLTHSDERIWRQYAGLSDFPHFDAYRIGAPSADLWVRYTRWGGRAARIRWAAPVETLGTMARSLRELNRPSSIAAWTQGPHTGWDIYDGRKRTSPTPDELRAQAYQVLSARITSLYWFNLTQESLQKFPDLVEPITEVNRHIRILEELLLESDAFREERWVTNGVATWDASVLAGPRGAVLFALDLTYEADMESKELKFGPARKESLAFALPRYLREPQQVLRVTPSSVETVPFQNTSEGVRLEAMMGPFSIFVAVPQGQPDLKRILQKRMEEQMRLELVGRR